MNRAFEMTAECNPYEIFHEDSKETLGLSQKPLVRFTRSMWLTECARWRELEVTRRHMVRIYDMDSTKSISEHTAHD